MIAFIPASALRVVRKWLARGSAITLNDRYDLAKAARCSVGEIDGAIQFIINEDGADAPGLLPCLTKRFDPDDPQFGGAK